MKKLSTNSRILIALAALLLVFTYFLPIWQIDLSAPQYPEGLSMQIWLNKLSGQVEIINGLNHYIGMKHIKAEMFPEFTYLVYIVGAFIALGLLVALAGRLNALLAYVLLLVAGGIAAMVDFYQWGYDYGHNLDPTAAIQVPGLSYQPPLIGHKQLLNFDAYSYPASGGWIIVASGLLLIGLLVKEWLRLRKQKISAHKASVHKAAASATVGLLLAALTGCSSQPQPFEIGKDGCHFCKMTIMTAQFGGEIVTSKGKVFKFDDLHCLQQFLKSGVVPQAEIAQTLTVNHAGKGDFVPVQQAYFVQSAQLRSPMGSNTAAFATKATADAAAKNIDGTVLQWASVKL